MRKIKLFYVPCRSRAEAVKIAKLCLQKKWAACGNIFPVESFYYWKENLEQTKEHILILKTTNQLESTLRKGIHSIHTYEVPCIACTEFKVNLSFFNWMNKQLKDRI
ncbi:MAG: divalent-cation tolerance protein CutA [Saprospiraceae bacterium]|nr:divalent-cation tolerance protein CutA [Saprospiraceae bacterium]